MKNIFRLLIILILPLTLQAQDAALVKQKAKALAMAMVKSDYKTIIDNTYPKAVEAAGGKEKLYTSIGTDLANMKKQGIAFESASIGNPGKFYKAGAETHCLIPEDITAKVPSGRIIVHSHLLGVSKDNGKSWTFLDLNNFNAQKVKQLIPNFNPALVIPATTTEQLK